MIRLTDEQWERIRMHFPEEHISDCRPGRKLIPNTVRVLEAVPVDSQQQVRNGYAAAKLSQLQNGTIDGYQGLVRR